MTVARRTLILAAASFISLGHSMSYAESSNNGSEYTVRCASENYIRTHGCARAPGIACHNQREFLYYIGSCWSDRVIHLLPENDDPILNITSAQLASHSTSELAEAIVYRHYIKSENPEIRNLVFDHPDHSLYAGLSLQMLFFDSIIEKISENGFLNGHQTHRNNVGLNETLRWKIEEGLTGISLPHTDPIAAELAPKYLFAIPNTEVLGYDMTFDSDNGRYGNILAVFRANDLKNRTTLTMGDSLVLGQQPDPHPARTSKWLQSTPERTLGPYIEAQVWGKLDLSSVDHLLVNCPGFVPISKHRIAEIYDSTNLPIYACELTNQPLGVERITKGALLKGKAGDRFQPKSSRKNWWKYLVAH